MQRLLIFIFVGISLLSYSQENKSFFLPNNYHYFYNEDAIVVGKDSTIVYSFSHSTFDTSFSSIVTYGIKSKKNNFLRFGNVNFYDLEKLNDNIFLIASDHNTITCFNAEINQVWRKSIDINENYRIKKLTDSTFLAFDTKNFFVINSRGKLLFSKKRDNLSRQGDLAILENKIILISSRYYGVPEGERILLEVYDFELNPVGLYTFDFPNYLYFDNIQIVKLNPTNQLIFSVGDNPLAFFKVGFTELMVKSLYVNSYQEEQINGVYQINDSTILGYGGTTSLGKSTVGYLSGPHRDFFVFKIDTSFNKKEFFSLGVLENFWGDETSSQFLVPFQNGFFASYISNNWNSNPKLNVNEYDFDSLYSCDAIYYGDSVFNSSVFKLPIYMDTLKKMTEISENIIDLPFLSFDSLSLAEDTLCINDCDFNVLITASYYDSWEDNDTYIKVEVNGKNHPYNIFWNDGDTTWIRENQFKSHSTFDVTDSAGCKRSFEYFFDRTIEVNELQKTKLNVYPNPTNGVLNFSTRSAQKINFLEVYDLFGRLVYELKDVELFEGYSIDLSFLQNGVYFVVSHTENNQFTNRIIISK